MQRNELIAKHFGLFITLKTKQKLNGLLDEHEANRPLYPELVAENERLRYVINQVALGQQGELKSEFIIRIIKLATNALNIKTDKK